jgi:hypothetical protein
LKTNRVLIVGPKVGLSKRTVSTKKNVSAPKQHEDTVLDIHSESDSLGVSKGKHRATMFQEDTFSQIDLSKKSDSENLYGDNDKDEQ